MDGHDLAALLPTQRGGASAGTAWSLRRLASSLVFWCGMALVSVVAIPAGILLCMVGVMLRALDRMMRWLERE